jgi:MoaA/NifB/PqqE/SkfB family radical SAM enzyme
LNPIHRAYLKAGLLGIPFNAHLDLTYRCNQHCLHCYLPEDWHRGKGPGPELNTAQAKSILDQLAAVGTLFLTFSGGEIFLRPDLMDLIEYARRLNFALALKTNGIMGPTDDQAAVLADLGIDSIQMSLYSLEPALHDRVTGVPGSLNKMLKTTDKCRSRGLQVSLNAMIFAFTFHQISDIKQYSIQEDIYLRMDGFLTPRWDGRPLPKDLAISPEENQEVIDLMGLESNTCLEADNPLFPELPPREKGCAAARTICYLTPVGDLWPCIDIAYNCGNVIGEGKFLESWQGSQRMNAIRAMHWQVPEGERLCDYFRRTRAEKIIGQFH